MSEGQFWDSFSKAVNILKQLDLLKSVETHRKRSYSQEGLTDSRSGNYHVIYRSMVDHQDYDILLFDDSLLQLTPGRMLFVQNPQKVISYEEYIRTYHSDECDLIFGKDDMFRGIYEEEYQRHLDSMSLNEGAVYCRYDESLEQYKPMVHPYAHLHIGLNNSIRIPLKREITPIGFVVFILQHVYYDTWVKEIKNTDSILHKMLCHVKYLNFLDIPNRWSNEEDNILYIS